MSGSRLLALALAAPLGVAAFHPGVAVAAQRPTCHGSHATIVVTGRSPHVVHGTAGRDVIVVQAAGHVVDAGAATTWSAGPPERT